MKLEQLLPHPKNPRKHLDIEELAGSIKESGLLSPILVRRNGKDEFQIISGHRRKAALEAMGEKYADCDIVEMSDEEAYRALMTANIQSHSLSEVEEAEGIKHMMDAFEWTQERVAKEFGKTQNWISMRLGLLKLESPVKEMIIARAINPSQARYINSLPEDKQEEIALKVADEGLSSRETAELVKEIIHPIVRDEIRTEPEIQEQLETNHQIEDRSDQPKPEETRLYADPDMKRISEMNGFILKLKDIALDLQPHTSIMDDLVEYNRSDEALHVLEKIAFRMEWMRKHITNAKSRKEGGGSEGTLLEFKRKEA